MYGTTMEMFLLYDPLLLLGWLSVFFFCPLWVLCLQLNLCCRVLRAHGGKLQDCRALLCALFLCVVLAD